MAGIKDYNLLLNDIMESLKKIGIDNNPKEPYSTCERTNDLKIKTYETDCNEFEDAYGQRP